MRFLRGILARGLLAFAVLLAAAALPARADDNVNKQITASASLPGYFSKADFLAQYKSAWPEVVDSIATPATNTPLGYINGEHLRSRLDVYNQQQARAPPSSDEWRTAQLDSPLFNSPAPWWVLRGTVPATLDFDFANGRYYQAGYAQGQSPANLLTTSRASTGYAADTSGNWTLFGNNVPRTTNQGLLVEEARTNNQTNSQFAAGWTAARTVLTTGAILSPDGAVNGSSLADNASSGAHAIFSTSSAFTAGSATVYTISIFVKPNTRQFGTIYISDAGTTNGFYVNFNANTGAITASGVFGAGAVTATSTATFGNGWFRITATGTQGSAGGTFLNVGTLNSGAASPSDAYVGNGSSFYIWQIQAEPGAFATSIIPTTSAAVTRAADVVTVTNPPVFGSAYTLFWAGIPLAPILYVNNQFPMSADDGTLNNRSQLIRAGTAFGVVNGSYSPGGINTGSTYWVGQSSIVMPTGSLSKIAAAFAASDQAGSINGNSVFINSTGTPTIPSIVHFGTRSDGTLQINGYISRAALWATTRQPNSVLQAITQ